jgi:hypothetical protein
MPMMNKKNNMANLDEQIIPFRVRIGVTGHRTLLEKEILSHRIKEVLERKIIDLFDKESKKLLKSSYHTPIGYSILTPLAEGADRLVAHEVLKFPHSNMDVVLPVDKEDYLKTFESQESQQEFEELLKRSRRSITLREKMLQNSNLEVSSSETRQKSYQDVGQYLVDHCDVLIALWDNKESRGRGGTAEIVEYAKKKNLPTVVISTETPHDISVVKGFGLNAKSIIGINTFNTFRVPEKEQRQYIENVYNDLFNNEEGRKLPEEAKHNILEKLLPFYVRASKMAKRNQNIYHFSGVLVYFFSACAVAAVALGILKHSLSVYAFSFELILLIAILFIVFFANKQKAHNKWIECRFLVERIRSAVFFAACGIEVSPIQIPPYMSIAHRPDDWMIKTFQEIWNRLSQMRGCQGQSCDLLSKLIRKTWIRQQIHFHKMKANKYEKINRILEIGGIVIFALAVMAALLHVIGHELMIGWFRNALVFAAIALPAFGAAVGGIRSHREFSRLSKRSTSMVAILEDLYERFSHVDRPELLESLLREVEELMLRETQHWLMLMKFVKLETVA